MTIAVPRWIATCLCVMLVCSHAAGAQVKPDLKNVAGDWEGTLELEGGSHPLTFVFTVVDTSVTGTMYDGAQISGRMERLTVSGDTVRFFIDKLAFTGVISGNRMQVALIVYNGNTRRFVAIRKPVDSKG